MNWKNRNEFKDYLDKIGEVGSVLEVLHTIIQVDGLPGAGLNEIIVFEQGQVGYVLSLMENYVEVLMLSAEQVQVGDRVARTSEFLEIEVGDELLGKHIDPLGKTFGDPFKFAKSEKRRIDISPPDFAGRKEVNQPLETGVRMVDLVVPLGRGQRQLVIGDRKTGKTAFLLQTIRTQLKRGTICVYTAMGRRSGEMPRLKQILEEEGIFEQMVIVSTDSPDAAGLIFITPYTGMTVAEYFRDQGKDVLLILDDMTNHAKYYRELSLLAGRFPGRSSYPGDVFYRHARLVERAGNFEKGSITCLPVAESVLGDLSGYIQTNLMSMTDGHLFFDSDLYNQGRRPAINPFLSVTRVGQQAQTPLVRDMSREIVVFLTENRKMQEFIHFGAELTEQVRQILAMGEQVVAFFDQFEAEGTAANLSTVLAGFLWAGYFRGQTITDTSKQMTKVINRYKADAEYKKMVDDLVTKHTKFIDFVNDLKQQQGQFLGAVLTANE